MEVQPNLLAVNARPPILATQGAAEETTEAEFVSASENASEERIIGGFFVSPLLRFDSEALAVLFQVRDPESGEVTRQFPRESVVEELREDRGRIDVDLIGTEENEARGEEARPELELATGPSQSDQVDTTVQVNGAPTSNGAPVIGGTTGSATGLTPGTQGVDLLV